MLHKKIYYKNHICGLCELHECGFSDVLLEQMICHKIHSCNLCDLHELYGCVSLIFLIFREDGRKNQFYIILLVHTHISIRKMSSNYQKHNVFVKNKQQNCESCGKSFPTSQGLKIHIHTVHEGHKDFKCDRVRPINRYCRLIGRLIGLANQRNPNIGSVSDRPIIRAHIGWSVWV